jgi:hypothetical protein
VELYLHSPYAFMACRFITILDAPVNARLLHVAPAVWVSDLIQVYDMITDDNPVFNLFAGTGDSCEPPVGHESR